MTAPVPPAHLSFIDGIFFLRPGLVVILEDDDLRVLPAQLNHRIHFGMQLLHRQRNRRDFLHELRANLLGNPAATGAGHEHARVVPVDADLGLHAAQKFQGLLRLLGLVALVVLPKNLVGRGVHHCRLHRGRANVEAHQKLSVMVVRLLVGSCGDLEQLRRLLFVSCKMVVHSISPIRLKMK